MSIANYTALAYQMSSVNIINDTVTFSITTLSNIPKMFVTGNLLEIWKNPDIIHLPTNCYQQLMYPLMQ